MTDSARRNSEIISALQGADEAFLQKAGILPQQTYALKEGLPVDETAKEYEGQLLRISQSVLPRNSAGQCASAYPIPFQLDIVHSQAGFVEKRHACMQSACLLFLCYCQVNMM